MTKDKRIDIRIRLTPEEAAHLDEMAREAGDNSRAEAARRLLQELIADDIAAHSAVQ